MSNNAVASAKNRRAGIKPTMPVSPQENQNQPQQPGLTLPQVIALIDTRLIKLEKFMNEQEQEQQSQNKNIFFPNNQESNEALPSNINEVLEEFQQRFLLLAEEINLLKDTLLKLQTYTMDVNKTLLEERISVLSDLGDNGDRFVLKHEEIYKNSNETEIEENSKEE
jgi:hypothetical protein